MAVLAGTKLGPYEILSPLGAGGMGEVYKARDTRLERTVAVKVLPQHLSSSPEVRQRFEREARTISQLSHPHICALHDVGHQDGVEYLVMEYLEGQTLADRLLRGPLSPEQVLRYGIEIADALDCAHRRGIVHRDLKPGNVMLTSSGVKLLDFGLAKLAAPLSSDAAFSVLPTQARTNLTAEGTILGTVQYMAPEQLEGKEADARTDIFALGAVLYEMATGKKAFQGASHASLITAIMSAKPQPVSAVQTLIPRSLDHVVEKCLAKDPEERWQSAKDVGSELEWILHLPPASEEHGGSRPGRSRTRERLAWSIAALLAAGLVVFAALRQRHPTPGLPARFPISIPPGTTYAPSQVSRGISISPDGTRLGIEAFSQGRRRLYVRSLDSDEWVELEGSLDATSHFWSPDGRFIAFYADGKLRKIPATGGPPLEICDASFGLVGTWNREGTILFSNLDPPGIFRISDTGGEAVRILTPEPSRQESNLIWPHFLPDGRRFLYLANKRNNYSTSDLNVASLDSKEIQLVTRLHSRVEYVPPGYLIYVRESALFAQRFDERRARLLGEPQMIASNVHYFFGPSHAAFSASQTGVLTYQTAARPREIVWFDRQGRRVGQLGEPQIVKGLRISNDGKRAAVDIEDRRTGTSDMWVTDLGSGVSTRLHSDPVDEAMPVWWPDGSKLLYRSDRGGPPDIYEITPGVPGSERPFLELPGVQQPEDVSRDGRFLAYLSGSEPALLHIWLLPLQGERKPIKWQGSRFHETSPRFSPDGRWIAFQSNESGVSEIYAALTEGAAEKRRISPSGGRMPRWRADGKELYYIAPNGTVMAVPVTLGSKLEAGVPAPLFRAEPEFQNYDVTPDGSRFLAAVALEKTPESPLRVILNWPAMLREPR